MSRIGQTAADQPTCRRGVSLLTRPHHTAATAAVCANRANNLAGSANTGVLAAGAARQLPPPTLPGTLSSGPRTYCNAG